MILGYSRKVITPPDIDRKKYYVSGYVFDTPAESVHDELWAEGVYIDEDGCSAVLISTDTTGFLHMDVEDVRRRLAGWCKENGIGSVHIFSIHNHSAVDTIGIWGEPDRQISGRDESYMEFIKEALCGLAREAFGNRREGKLYYGETLVPGSVRDCREPFNPDERLRRFRFVPDDGPETHIYHFSCHAEGMGPFNHEICADYKYYWEKEVTERARCNFMFINGAVGGMLTLAQLRDENGQALEKRALIERFGHMLAQSSLGIRDERELRGMSLKSERVKIPVENLSFIAAYEAGIFPSGMLEEKDGEHILNTEVSLMRLGGLSVCFIPGELFNELVDGRYLEYSLRANKSAADERPLADIVGDRDPIVFGLADDEIGYILPEHDFYHNESWTTVYDAEGFQSVTDPLGRNHYEETNSVSAKTAKTVLAAFEKLVG